MSQKGCKLCRTSRSHLYWALFPVMQPFLGQTESSRLRTAIASGKRVHSIETLRADRPRHCIECERHFQQQVPDVVIPEANIAQLYWITRCSFHGCLLSERQEPFPDDLLYSAPRLCGADLALLNRVQRDTQYLERSRLPPTGAQRWQKFHRLAVFQRFGIEPPYRPTDILRVAEFPSRRLRAHLRLHVRSFRDNWVTPLLVGNKACYNVAYHLTLLAVCNVQLSASLVAIMKEQAADHGRGVSMRQMFLRI